MVKKRIQHEKFLKIYRYGFGIDDLLEGLSLMIQEVMVNSVTLDTEMRLERHRYLVYPNKKGNKY
jgi:hypothetical protein